MAIIDIDFDFRQDSKCGDPDTDSQKLYEAHKLLWSKELPNGKIFTLEIIKSSSIFNIVKNKSFKYVKYAYSCFCVSSGVACVPCK